MSLTSVNIRPDNAIGVLDKEQGWISLIRRSGEEIDIVNAARVSFGKFRTEFGEADKKLLNFLIKEKHFAPLEHITFSFLVHCPLFVRGQWHRHRCWSYNEISRRYTEVDLEFYLPSKFRKQSTDNKQASEDDNFLDSMTTLSVLSVFRDTTLSLTKIYNDLLASGVCREQARSILPQNMMTTFYASTDLRNLLHFLSLRMDKHAQWEIRQYANAIYEMLKKDYPNVMEAFDEGLIK